MEKYFIITEKSPLHKIYYDYKENQEEIRLAFLLFATNVGISAHAFIMRKEWLAIETTEDDELKFGKELCKKSGELRSFKKNSKTFKKYLAFIDYKELKFLWKPRLQDYFGHGTGRSSSRLFTINDILYCSYDNGCDFETPENMEEIKASEFFKVIEDWEEKQKVN